MNMDMSLKTENLVAGYNKKPLIKDINITAVKGKIMTLIGPNGAGKTTVIKTLINQLSPVGGAVYISDDNVNDISNTEFAKKVSVVLTTRPKTELMTVREVVEMGRYPYTGNFGLLSKDDQKVVSGAMDLTNVSEIADCDFSKISDGQRQRVMLAKAICQEPELIILDEPTSFLDIHYKLEFMGILQMLTRKKNIAVIISLHELDLAKRVSDIIVCVKGDCIDKMGTPEEIFEDGYIQGLYNVPEYYTELDKPGGEPDIFVIAGNGTGAPLFRKLQRQGKAFYAGILYENDTDYKVAKALARDVVCVSAFEIISEDEVRQAKELIDKCSRVYNTLEKELERKLAKPLLDVYNYALETGKLVTDGI